MRRFYAGMIVRFAGDGSLARITKVSDKDVYYKRLGIGSYEAREDIEFFSSLASDQSLQKYRWAVVT